MKQFNIGLTGLTTHQRALETSASNLANASTVGYKTGEFLFADQFSTYLSQTDAGKVGQGAMEIGVRRNFSQGATRKTGGQFDVAISGDGFLITSPTNAATGGPQFLTRNGQLSVDKGRYLVNSNGQFVLGRATYPTTGETSTNELVPLSLPPETLDPSATIDAKLSLNLNRTIQAPETRASAAAYRTTRFDFNPKDPGTFDYSQSITVYDTVGAKHDMKYYFRREDGLAVNQWAMYVYMDDYAMQLDDAGNWTVVAPELDESGTPRRDVKGALVQTLYEPTYDSKLKVDETLQLGIDLTSKVKTGTTLGGGLSVDSVSIDSDFLTKAGTATFAQAGVDTLRFSYGGTTYTTGAIANIAANSQSPAIEFKDANNNVGLTLVLDNASGNAITTSEILTALTSAQTDSFVIGSAKITSMNFGEGAAETTYDIVETNNLLELQVGGQAIGFASSVETLESGASQSLSFTDRNGVTLMTIDIQNTTDDALSQTQLINLIKDTTSNGSVTTEKSDVRRPQAKRYVYEVDPTTGRMLNTLDEPTAKIFESQPNGEPALNPLIKPTPAFKYAVDLGGARVVEGVPFGGTNPTLHFEISELNITSVSSPNEMITSTQVGGRSRSRITGLTIDPGGRLVARYSNGDVLYGGRIALANVPAPNGLIPVGTNLFQESFFSGERTVGNPGDPGYATLKAENVEDSNLDLAQELVRLTQLQRIYQANAKTISSADEMLQSLLNIR